VGLKSPAITDEGAPGASDKQRIGGVSTTTGADQRSPISFTESAPAKFQSNPNAAAYTTVHVFPGGRW